MFGGTPRWRRTSCLTERAKAAEKSGAGAVQLSTQQNSMQMNTQAVASDDKDEKEQIVLRNTINNQFVANKNFTNQNGVWIDSDYSETSRLPEVSVRFASDIFFELLKSEPALASYFALGDQVVVVWKRKGLPGNQVRARATDEKKGKGDFWPRKYYPNGQASPFLILEVMH